MLHIFFLFQLVAYGQDTNTDSCDIYLLSLAKRIEKKNYPVVIKFEFRMSESLLSGLESSNLIDSEILGQLKSQQNRFTFTKKACDKVRSLFIDQKVYNNASTLEEYVLINLAEPIFTNESEAYLFFDHLIMITGRGVAGGGSILQIFCKKDEQWYIKSTDILEMY